MLIPLSPKPDVMLVIQSFPQSFNALMNQCILNYL